MPSHQDQHHLPYSPQQLFDLVADIEHYPEFIPWCRAARIISREENVLLAELIIHFSHITKSYTSRVTLTPPTDNTPGKVEAKMVSGPFEHLLNNWEFVADGTGTRVDFMLDFKFRSKMLDMMMGDMFDKAVAKMSDAFRRRAEALYGPKSGA